MKALIESSQVLGMVKQRLRLTYTSDQDVYLDGLILEGERRLSTNETLIIKDCEVTVQNNKFYMPDDCKRILVLRSQNSCISGVFLDVPFFKSCGCNVNFYNNPLVNIANINGRWVNFLNTIPDDTVLDIAYQRLNTGDDGMMIINEEHEIALIAYACYQFGLTYPQDYTPLQINMWKAEYNVQANKVRGLAARRQFDQDKLQIEQKINQMVNTSVPMSILTGYYNSFFYPTITSI